MIAPPEHPAFANFSEVIPLSGFSGATVALLRTSSGNPFVRKAANSLAANAGITAQSARQEWLRATIGDVASVPRVLDKSEAQGLRFYDMEFAPARDAINYLSTATFEQVAMFSDRIEQLMRALASASPRAPAIPPSRATLAAKLEQISERSGGTYAEELTTLHEALLLMDEITRPDLPTASHGDLTFENILVGRRGDLCLIDPIESPFDHYWFDWSKLFQECEGHWHVHRGRKIATSVTWWLRDRWMKAAASQSPLYPARHYFFLGLTFARILPYAHSEADSAFVARRVAGFGRAAIDTIRSQR
ncbi:phosphotransferase [Aminobacter carboxidus]|uniref:Phosphotransferase n=1 Tax=Aminobacter carboxidus TaxID=376165 RepID=A0ABR9GP54_9HYPH|nr:phosphotransferase [Aminobacter carboxidus]MBE1205454.1 phosphotransferase [Aminobacter carboxidus]